MRKSESIRILIIDDEKVVRDGCERSLACDGMAIDKVESGEKAIARLEKDNFDIVLLDLMMPGIDGFTVLRWIREHKPDIQVIVITGFSTVDKAVAAMKEGAFDFVGKPFTPDHIRIVVQRAVEKRSLIVEAAQLREQQALDLETIAEEQSRLKTVFSCMEGAILVTNWEGVVVLHNPGAIRVLDLETDPVIGRPLADSVRDGNAVAMVKEVMDEGKTVTREFPPGSISRLYLRAHCAPVQTAAGIILGSITVFEDITAHKQIDQQKSEFVAMVSHELRAPLASVEQMIYSIRSCRVEDVERRTYLLDRISARIREQLQLIENLLNLSKLETGTVVFNMEPANGNEILDEVIEVVRPRAEGGRIDLVCQSCPVEWWINADRDQILGVFINIIDNAIKYTPAGGSVTVTASADGTRAKVRIADTGIGIRAEDLPHIFDRFFRVRGKDTRGITGSGLGLSLVKKVVEAHRGCVDVESEPNRGTTFSVSLPLVEPLKRASAGCRGPATQPGGQSR